MLNTLIRNFPNNIFKRLPDEKFYFEGQMVSICAVQNCPKCHIPIKMFSLDYLKKLLKNKQGVKSCDAGLFKNNTLILIEFGKSVSTHSPEYVREKVEDTLHTIDTLANKFLQNTTPKEIIVFYIYSSPNPYRNKLLFSLGLLNNASHNNNVASNSFSFNFMNKNYIMPFHSIHCKEFVNKYNSI